MPERRRRLETEVMLAKHIYRSCQAAEEVKVAVVEDAGADIYDVQIDLGERRLTPNDVEFELPEDYTTSDFVDQTAYIDDDNVLHFTTYWFSLEEEDVFQITEDGAVVR